MNKPLIIVNSINDNYKSSGLVYTWTGYLESSSNFSILKFIEEHADELRAKYLEFIHDLGEYELQNYKIRDHLEVDGELSLWWMSLLAEKSPWKSPKIIDCIKVMAVEKIIDNKSPNQIILQIDNKNLARTLENLCKKLEISFLWLPGKKNNHSKTIFLFDTFLRFYNKLLGLTYLCYYFLTRWGFKERVIDGKSTSHDSIFLSSYFYNLDLGKASKGFYFSRQWGELPQYLNSIGQNTFHLENYIKSPEIPNLRDAKKIRKLFTNIRGVNNHIFLDQHLSMKFFLNILLTYFKIISKPINIKLIRPAFDVRKSKLNLWPLMKDDWFSSVGGKNVVANLIWLRLFNSHLESISYQKLGFYLCENMGWERALIHAWKSNGHGKLVAVPHSTIRFWDLRYFSDHRVNMSPNKYSLPVPDYYALNGEMAFKSFTKNQYIESSLLKSEALRYQFLERSITNPENGNLNENNNGLLNPKMLILGDFTKSQTHLMLKELESLIIKYHFLIDLTIKPHPVSEIISSDYPKLSLSITHKPLQKITNNFDIIFSSNTTSASLDCFLMGKKVMIFMDENNLNFSPLRNVNGVSFVRNYHEIYFELKSEKSPYEPSKINSFFWIDKDMSKWKKIIKRLN